jgi:hypothetical protein
MQIITIALIHGLLRCVPESAPLILSDIDTYRMIIGVTAVIEFHVFYDWHLLGDTLVSSAILLPGVS